MTTTMTQARPVATQPVRFPDALVIGGCFVAPLDLLIVRSYTVYDLLISIALLYLLRERRLVWPSRGYLAASYVFIVAALAGAFRASYAVEALTQVLQYAFIFFVLVPVVISVVTTRSRAITSIALLCTGTLAAILYSWIYRPTTGADRVVVFYSENPNRLGYPAAYIIPLLLVLWLLSRRADRRVRVVVTLATLAGLYLMIWAVTASGSRSSLLGGTVALVIVVALRPGLGLWRSLGRLVALVVVCGILGLAAVATGQTSGVLQERINRSLDSSDPSEQAQLLGDRENLNSAGVAAFLETPLVGTGLDNFRYVAPRYDVEATAQLPHNLWLQLLVQVGALGAAAFAAWLVLWGLDMVRTTRRAPPPDALLLWGLFAALAGVLTIFLFAPEMLDRHYWLIAALGLAAVRGCRSANSQRGPLS